MAIPFQNPPDTPLNFHKFKKNPCKNQNHEKSKKLNHKNQTNLKSFWAFLSSIFIYISIFYTFNLSPYTLLCTTKFWFFISNTLIFIIAADYISFSSSKNHEYYVEKSSKILENPTIFSSHIMIVQEEKPNEKIIKMVEDQTREDKHEVLRIKDKEDPDPVQDPNPDPDHEFGEKKNGPKCSRSKSDVVSSAAAEEKVVLQRTLSERHDDDDDDDEFSRMSDEELNWRVEEFIRRFNRQIRLQANSTN